MSSEKKTISFCEVVTVGNALNMSRYNENKLDSYYRWKGEECNDCKPGTYADMALHSLETNALTRTHDAVPRKK